MKLMPSKKLDESMARFIIQEVILGMEYLHTKMRIIYRDLKPENLLVSKEGHIQITDFGLSEYFKDPSDTSCFSAGTPEYLAPEIILKKPHNKNIDLWCMGILMYEMMAGHTPFIDKK